MTAPLPTWAATPEAAALLCAIKLEQPEPLFIRRNAWANCREPRYRGNNAKALRALWEQGRDAAMKANDRDAYARLTNREDPDDLIARVLCAWFVRPELHMIDVPFTPMRFDTDPETGNSRVAA